jgi:alanyl-tRNA synthetase
MDTHLDLSRFIQSREGILSILTLEEQRYYEMLRKGQAAVRTALRDLPEDTEEVPDEILFRLAEERGLNPEMVVSIANRAGWTELRVRVGFSADMAARNAERTKAAAKEKVKGVIFSIDQFPRTIRDYYDDTSATSFNASVLECSKLDEYQINALNLSPEVKIKPTHSVILDRTLFYPEGGGQLGDQGVIGNVNVVDTRIENEVIIHLTDEPVKVGSIEGEVNWHRRRQLMDHHTAVHIVGGSARQLLGPHIWQAGSNKGERYARIDLTHYNRLSRDDLNNIEDHANEIIAANPIIEKKILSRAEADVQFGFELYQGGPPKKSMIRIIKIGDHDVQACGGTHHDKAGEVGELRIIRSSQVQDGVERLQIVAGETAREHARAQERLLAESSAVLGVAPNDLPAAVSRFFEEWKLQQKKIESLESEIVRLRTSGGGDDAIEKDGIRYAVMEVNGDMKQMMTMLGQLTRDSSKPTLAVLGTRDGGGKLIVASTEGTIAAEIHDANKILKAIASHINGGGGGRPTMAQGGGSNPDGIPAALEAARKLLGL